MFHVSCFMVTMAEEKEKKQAPIKAPESKEALKVEAKEDAPQVKGEKGKEGKKEAKMKERPKKPLEVAGEEVEVPEKFKEIVNQISEMSVLDLSKLVKVLEKKFDVKASGAVPAAVAAPGTLARAEDLGEEKERFIVFLKGIGEKKIEVIKAVRDITGKGLKDSKDLVDAAATKPQVIKENVKKEEAEELRDKLTAAGATVEMK